ncbi:Caudovirales tail fiber assembly protein, partial [Gilliamella apis SCGC AB-598-P17]
EIYEIASVQSDTELTLAKHYDGETKSGLDEDEQNAFKIKQNKVLKTSLLNEANENISILQDAIDFDMVEDGDEEKLKTWKKYRILLNRIDVNQAPDIEWPEKPQ